MKLANYGNPQKLYNFVAQAESSLSSRIAAAAGLDSSAMKTLAFVTTVFLPPTFVAVRVVQDLQAIPAD